jgi:malate permease and related proteins
MFTFFFHVAFNVVLPIFLVMGLGYGLAKKFTLDLNTLSKLNFYVFIPVYMFYSLLWFKPSSQNMVESMAFNVLFAGLSFAAMALIAKALRFQKSLVPMSLLTSVIFNSANYGIPVVQQAFQEEAIPIQIVTITVMNVLTYTAGVLITGGWGEWREGLKTILKLPILYALFGALILRALTLPLMSSLKWTSDGMLSIALLTLGAQLAQGGLSLKHPKELWVTVAGRLILGPILALLILKVIGITGLTAKVLFVSSAFPTAVITVMFGIEYKRAPLFAADVVFLTTLLSAASVTLAIGLANYLF